MARRSVSSIIEAAEAEIERLQALVNKRNELIALLGLPSGSIRMNGRAPGHGGVNRRTRRRKGESVTSRTLRFLSDVREAKVGDIAAALKMGDKQKKGLSVALSNAKRAGLLAAGSERGFWRATPKGREAAKAVKSPDA